MYNTRVASLIAGLSLAATALITPAALATTDDPDNPPAENCVWVDTVPAGSVTETRGQDFPADASKTILPAGWTHTIDVNYDAGAERIIVISWPAGTAPGTYTVEFFDSLGNALPSIDVTVEATAGHWDCNEGSALGSAALGLSALAGSALIASSVQDGDAPQEAPAPAEEVADPKAEAQAQAEKAATAPAPVPAAAPAEQAAPEKQLANTGVESTLMALAAELLAVSAGVLLLLRRRA